MRPAVGPLGGRLSSLILFEREPAPTFRPEALQRLGMQLEGID
jgi:hypothetical protein